MTFLANLCLSLALLVYALPLQAALRQTGKGSSHGAAIFAALLLFIPLWALIAGGLSAAVARGSFDWVLSGRCKQAALFVAICTALMVLTGFAFIGRDENPIHLPFTVRPFVGWADVVLPLLVIAFTAVAVNPALARWIPPSTLRIPLLLVGAVAFFTATGFVLEALLARQRRHAEWEHAAAKQEEKRDKMILERVESLDPVQHIDQLLQFTSPHETPAIRERALRKVRAHPNLTRAVLEALRGRAPAGALAYLEGCEAAEAQTYASGFPQAVRELAFDARRLLERAHTVTGDEFNWKTSLILSVADKLAGSVDVVACVREYRTALDTPRQPAVQIQAASTLDLWLRRQAPQPLRTTTLQTP